MAHEREIEQIVSRIYQEGDDEGMLRVCARGWVEELYAHLRDDLTNKGLPSRL
jgi:hypothetical protein